MSFLPSFLQKAQLTLLISVTHKAALMKFQPHEPPAKFELHAGRMSLGADGVVIQAVLEWNEPQCHHYTNCNNLSIK